MHGEREPGEAAAMARGTDTGLGAGGRDYVVGITGASGAILAERLVRHLLEAGHRVHLTASRTGRQVIHEELGSADGERGLLPSLRHERLVEWAERDFRAPFASGSAPIAGMAVIPCSLATVAAIAAGTSDNLLRRGAEVMLKERRRLVLVPREAPLSVIHLRNLLAVAEAGAVVIPPVLTFYQRPGQGVADQVDFVVSRVLDHLGVENELFPRWGTMA
jgi:4-hydroxy-3-polyprenylbenzoate decarboxylase